MGDVTAKERMPGRVRALTWLCALLYFSSYLLRNNFAAMLVRICEDMGQPKTALAVVVTAMTVCYGTGQLINGLVGDKIAPRYMLMCGVTIAGLTNIAMFFCTAIPVMAAVWAVNGLANSMLWAPLVRLFSTTMTEKQYSYGMLRVMFASSSSKVVLYLVCPMLLLLMPWRAVTLSIGIFGVAVGLLFAVLSAPLCRPGQAVEKREERKTQEEPVVREPLPRGTWLPIALIVLAILLQGILRDAMATWTPSFLKDVFAIPAERAILATAVLAVFDVMSFFLYDIINRKFFHDEVLTSAALFSLSTVAALTLWLTGLFTSIMALSLICLTLIESCMHGVNLMLLAHAPRRLVKSGHVSFFTGFFDAFSYAGGALSAYGFAYTADNYGWNTTALLWFVTAALGILTCLAAVPLWRRFRRIYADVPAPAPEATDAPVEVETTQNNA